MARGMNLLALGVAIGAGLVSITSPCCLPLLPGYLGYLSGFAPQESASRRWRTVAAALLFVAGFTVIFVALGATASILGAALIAQRAPMSRLAGGFILLLGLFLLLESRVPLLSRAGDWSRWARGGRLWAAPVLGAAFALTWTPCIGPVLGAILTLAGSAGDLQQGVLLLLAYSLGLAIPFVALSVWMVRVQTWLRRVGRAASLFQSASAGLLVAMGLLLLTDRWLPLMAPLLAWYAQARWPPV